MFLVALFAKARKTKQSKCPCIPDWLNKLWNIYTRKDYATLRKICTKGKMFKSITEENR
jgi:hypothetical protein